MINNEAPEGQPASAVLLLRKAAEEGRGYIGISPSFLTPFSSNYSRNTTLNIFLLLRQAALMDSIEQVAKDNNDEEESPETPSCALVQGTLKKHLRLDSAAAAAVTLLPDPSAPHQYGSLYDVLNR